jgi:hypothetical protein
MYTRPGQHSANGNLRIGNIQMQFIAAPVLLVIFTTLLGADLALSVGG